MITKQTLDNLRFRQQKPCFGSQAKAMFANGHFNPDNWNGGDGIIRQYCKYIENQVYYDHCEKKHVIPLIRYEIECSNGNHSFDSNIHVNYSSHEDMKFLTVISNGCFYDEHSDNDWFVDVYTFQWYKDKGRTSSVLLNGKPITEDQYTVLLNMIEQTGFKFRLENE